MKTTAIQALSAEHRNIENVVRSLADAAASLEQQRRLNSAKLRSAVEFLRVYADERHHGREEQLLFPLLVKRGVPAQGCPIGGLNHEHEKARGLVSALEEWIAFYEQRRPGADHALGLVLQSLIEFYKKHLWMEDAMVFPMAERLLTEADHQQLTEEFSSLDRSIGLDTIQRWEQFAANLSFQTGATTPAGGCGLAVPASPGGGHS